MTRSTERLWGFYSRSSQLLSENFLCYLIMSLLRAGWDRWWCIRPSFCVWKLQFTFWRLLVYILLEKISDFGFVLDYTTGEEIDKRLIKKVFLHSSWTSRTNICSPLNLKVTLPSSNIRKVEFNIWTFYFFFLLKFLYNIYILAVSSSFLRR